MSANTAGALLMMLSMSAFVVNDLFLKLTGGALPLFQLIFVRGILATLLIYGIARCTGGLLSGISGRDQALIALWGIAEIGTAYFFLTALFNMPIGNLSAIMQVAPLTVTLASLVFLGETVGWRRMLAILIGFAGVVLIIRPGVDGFNIWSLYALAAVLGVTLRDMVTRQLSVGVPGMTVTLGTTLAVTLAAGLASLTQPYAPITPPLAGSIVASALFVSIGYFASVQAMRTGAVSFVAPFRYSGLVAAMLAGFLCLAKSPRG